MSAEPAPARPTASKASPARHSNASAASSMAFGLAWRVKSQALIDEPTMTPDAVMANSPAKPVFDTP